MADRTKIEKVRDQRDALAATLVEVQRELLAARARIAKLEQEPPMALVDFGVGFNWKGLREDMQRLREERDVARAQLHADDQRAWESLGKPEGTYSTTNVQRLCAEVERLRAELRRMSEWHDQIADTVPCDAAGPHYGIVEWHLKVLAELDAARAEVQQLRADLREVAASGVEVECRQYVTVQIDPATWKKIQEVAHG